MYQYARPPKRKKNKTPKHWLFWLLTSSLVISLLVTGFLIGTAFKDFTFPSLFQRLRADQNDPAAQIGVEIASEDGVGGREFDDINAPLQHRNGPAPRSWDGKSRINILLLGVDDRTWNTGDGPPRTDTMILLTINPENNTAGMLSLPRDLWLEIPGQGGDYYKINQAYTLGEAQGLAGGGAGLAMDTVERFLGISVPFYVQINFNAFINLIDQMGGVKIDVPETMTIDPLGDNNIKVVQQGVQTLPGDLALAYVRNRDTGGGDFDRAQRQQQVLRAVESRLTDLDILPTLIRKAPSIYDEVSNGVNTNLTAGQILKLSQLAYSTPTENINSLAITQDHAYAGISWNGLYILTPIDEKIEQLKAVLFSTQLSAIAPTVAPTAVNAPTVEQPTPSQVTANDTSEQSPSAEAQPLATEAMQPIIAPMSEEAAITVHNGAQIAGLAGDTARYFELNHLQIYDIDNADTVYDFTTIIDYTGKPETLAALVTLLDLSTLKTYQQFNPDSEVDILVILGKDWANDNPLP